MISDIWNLDRNRFTVWGAYIAFYCWFMTFPYNYNYSVLRILSGIGGMPVETLNLIVMASFAVGTLVGLLFLGDRHGRRKMLGFCLGWIVLTVLMFIVRNGAWYPVLAILWGLCIGGLFSMLVMGIIFYTRSDEWVRRVSWSYIFIQAIIYAVMIFPVENNSLIPIVLTFAAQGICLLFCLFYRGDIIQVRSRIEPKELSKANLATSLLTIFFIYVSFAVVKNIVMPVYRGYDSQVAIYSILPNYLTLLFFFIWGNRLRLTDFLRIGSALIGLTYIGYLIFPASLLGRMVSDAFMQPAYLFIDIFIYSFMGRMAYKYGKNFYTGRMLLLTMTLTTAVGEPLVSRYLRSAIAWNDGIFAVVFIAVIAKLLLIPSVEKVVISELESLPQSLNSIEDGLLGTELEADAVDSPEREMHSDEESPGPMERMLLVLPEDVSLTPRETNVLEMILQRQDTDVMVDLLGISKNTLKIHLRNVYGKFRVRNKRELLSLTEESSEALSCTLREREVLDLMSSGCSTEEIALRLGISQATARVHVWRVRGKIEKEQKEAIQKCES